MAELLVVRSPGRVRLFLGANGDEAFVRPTFQRLQQHQIRRADHDKSHEDSGGATPESQDEWITVGEHRRWYDSLRGDCSDRKL